MILMLCSFSCTLDLFLYRCDDYPPTVCSLNLSISLTPYIEVLIPVSKEAQLYLMDTASAVCYIMFFYLQWVRAE
jgi:hypothetical protein